MFVIRIRIHCIFERVTSAVNYQGDLAAFERIIISQFLAVLFSVTRERRSERLYVIMIAKHALIVTCRDLLLTIVLIRRPFAIPTAGVTATIDSVQPFYPVRIERFSTKRR